MLFLNIMASDRRAPLMLQTLSYLAFNLKNKTIVVIYEIAINLYYSIVKYPDREPKLLRGTCGIRRMDVNGPLSK